MGGGWVQQVAPQGAGMMAGCRNRRQRLSFLLDEVEGGLHLSFHFPICLAIPATSAAAHTKEYLTAFCAGTIMRCIQA